MSLGSFISLLIIIFNILHQVLLVISILLVILEELLHRTFFYLDISYIKGYNDVVLVICNVSLKHYAKINTYSIIKMYWKWFI